MTTDGPQATNLSATLTGAACLLLCLLPISALCVLWFAERGPLAVRAAAAAATLTTAAMVSAYVATALGGSHAAPTGALLGIGFRTGLPLAALLLVGKLRADWVEAGFNSALLACYLPSLLVETCFAARTLGRRQSNKQRSDTQRSHAPPAPLASLSGPGGGGDVDISGDPPEAL